jgi:hypothetical protein
LLDGGFDDGFDDGGVGGIRYMTGSPLAVN